MSWLALFVLTAGALDAPRAFPPCAACVSFEADPAAARLLRDGRRGEGLEVFLRPPPEAAPAAVADLAAELQGMGAMVGLVVGLEDPPPEWLAAAAPYASAFLVRVTAPPSAGQDPALLSLRARQRATLVRSLKPAAKVGLDLEGPGVPVEALAPYVDFLVTREPLAGGPQSWKRVDGSALGSLSAALEATAQSGGARILAPLTEETLPVAVALGRLRDVLPADLSPLSEVTLSCGETPCPHRTYLHPRTLDAIVVASAETPLTSVALRPGARQVDLFVPGGDERSLPLQPQRGGVGLSLPGIAGAFVLRVSGWADLGDRFASGVDVLGARDLTVQEVIARHQAAAAAQARRVTHLVSAGTTVLTFQVPGLAAPMTVTAETVVFQAGDLHEVEQRGIRMNGAPVAVARDGVPHLPILEPERVTSPPLVIALTDDYRYTLAGREKVEGEDCHVVAFTPLVRDRPLFEGRAWISSRDFGIVRSEADQTGLKRAIVSSRQEDRFRRHGLEGGAAWLPERSETHQIYEGAGHRTPIHRATTYESHDVNPPDFAARLEAARASASVLLRETAEGYRYLRRTESPTPGAPPVREVAGRSTRVTSLAVGALFDPNIDGPLPFAGLSFVDFDFLGTGTQVNAFLAGPFLQAAWNVPSLGGRRLQLQGSAFASLVRYHDRAFCDGRERYEENLRQRPLRVTLALIAPFASRGRLRVGYEGSAPRLEAADSTSPTFVVPRSPFVHGLRLALELESGRWSLAAWWTPSWRDRWAAWGFRSADHEKARTYQRYGASAARSFLLSPRVVARLDASAMAGTDLDRFSRYTFDGFDNRLRGYPSASLRFDRGAALRSALAWNVARGVRLDGFLDGAWVRDPGFGSRSRVYMGTGAGLEAALPWNALATVEWGFGLQARDRDGNRGAHVVRLTAYRVF